VKGGIEKGSCSTPVWIKKSFSVESPDGIPVKYSAICTLLFTCFSKTLCYVLQPSKEIGEKAEKMEEVDEIDPVPSAQNSLKVNQVFTSNI